MGDVIEKIMAITFEQSPAYITLAVTFYVFYKFATGIIKEKLEKIIVNQDEILDKVGRCPYVKTNDE